MKYGFLVGGNDNEVVLGKDKISGLFKSTSERCPITKYRLVKNDGEEGLANDDEIRKFVKFDEDALEMSISNSYGATGSFEFYL